MTSDEGVERAFCPRGSNPPSSFTTLAGAYILLDHWWSPGGPIALVSIQSGSSRILLPFSIKRQKVKSVED